MGKKVSTTNNPRKPNAIPSEPAAVLALSTNGGSPWLFAEISESVAMGMGVGVGVLSGGRVFSGNGVAGPSGVPLGEEES